MSRLEQLIDKAQHCVIPPTHYRLAKTLGTTPSAIPTWKRRGSASFPTIVKLCEITGEDPGKIYKEIYLEKTKKTAAILLSIAVMATTSYTPESRASISSAVDRLCIMSNDDYPFDSVTWSY